jgi:hypothetical protein
MPRKTKRTLSSANQNSEQIHSKPKMEHQDPVLHHEPKSSPMNDDAEVPIDEKTFNATKEKLLNLLSEMCTDEYLSRRTKEEKDELMTSLTKFNASVQTLLNKEE